jgi:hypothetical protein
MRPRVLLFVVLVALAGCGDDDENGGSGEKTSTAPKTSAQAKTVTPSGLSPEEKKVAAGVAELLEAESGEDACFEALGAQYVEELGGEEKCAKAFDPLVTGDYNTISSVKVIKPGDQGKAEAEVTSSGGGSPVKMTLVFASPGSWNVTRVDNLPR